MEREESGDRKEGDFIGEKISKFACPKSAYTWQLRTAFHGISLLPAWILFECDETICTIRLVLLGRDSVNAWEPSMHSACSRKRCVHKEKCPH